MEKMAFFDLHIVGKDFKTDLENISEAFRLGWRSVGLIYSEKNFNLHFEYKKQLISKIEEDFDLNQNYINMPSSSNFKSIYFGLELNSNNPNDIRKYSQKYSNKYDLFMVLGGSDKINRLVCENRQVDILSKPYNKRHDCGINHVLAKLAFDNNITIELCFNDLLGSFLSYRSKILSYFRDIILLQRKFKFPLIFSSKGSSIFDLRSPFDEIAILKSLGLNDDEIKSSLNTFAFDLIKFNKEKKDMPILGVKCLNKDNEQ
jgi:ribonuclease P/MRP protein subunit RPP1